MSKLSINSSSSRPEEPLSGAYWGELRIFLEVAQGKSFNNAAKRLKLSHPTIARKVRRLEHQMGIQLLTSTERGIKLTPRGQELAEALGNLDQSLYAITSGVQEDSRNGRASVRISITDGLNAFFLTPQIEAFSEKYPKIHLHTKNVVDLNDVRENQTDMMLTFVPDSRGDLVVKRLGSLHLRPVASRSYVEKYGLPTRANVGRHMFLQSHFYESSPEVWADWLDLVAKGRVSHHCDDTFVYGLMVRRGLGIGLLGNDTTSASDAVPLELGVRISLPLHAIALEQRLRSRPVKIAFDWLCDVFSEKNPWLRPDLSNDDGLPCFEALSLISLRCSCPQKLLCEPLPDLSQSA